MLPPAPGIALGAELGAPNEKGAGDAEALGVGVLPKANVLLPALGVAVDVLPAPNWNMPELLLVPLLLLALGAPKVKGCDA